MLWRAIVVTVLLVSAAWGQTDQRPGPDGEFGKSMQIGVQAPLYFTLKSAEYSASRIIVDKLLWAPGHDEKLLIIHYSIQNPTKKVINYQATTPKFELCDDKNNSFGPLAMGIGMGLEDSGKRVDMALQPAQTIQIYTGFRVPAEAICSKLIVLPSGPTEPVIRYDLTRHVKGLEPPFADDLDTSQALRVPEFAATKGEWYPMARHDLRLDDPLTVQDGPPDRLAKGTHWMVAVASLRVPGKEPATVAMGKFNAIVRLADEREVKAFGLYGAKSWDRLDQEVRPNSELVVRLAFAVPDNSPAQQLRIEMKSWDGSRRHTQTLRYDCTPAAPAGG